MNFNLTTCGSNWMVKFHQDHYMIESIQYPNEKYRFDSFDVAYSCAKIFNLGGEEVYLSDLGEVGITNSFSFANAGLFSTQYKDIGLVRTLLILAIFGKSNQISVRNKWTVKFDRWEAKFRDFLFILMYGTGNDK